MHSTVLLLGQGSVGRWEGGAEQSTAGRYPRGVRPAGLHTLLLSLLDPRRSPVCVARRLRPASAGLAAGLRCCMVALPFGALVPG
jgi:hypothetical protein